MAQHEEPTGEGGGGVHRARGAAHREGMKEGRGGEGRVTLEFQAEGNEGGWGEGGLQSFGAPGRLRAVGEEGEDGARSLGLPTHQLHVRFPCNIICQTICEYRYVSERQTLAAHKCHIQ